MKAKGNLSDKMVWFSGTDVGLGAGDLGWLCCVACCVTLAVLLTSLNLRNLPYQVKDLDWLGNMSWEFFPHCFQAGRLLPGPGWRQHSGCAGGLHRWGFRAHRLDRG